MLRLAKETGKVNPRQTFFGQSIRFHLIDRSQVDFMLEVQKIGSQVEIQQGKRGCCKRTSDGCFTTERSGYGSTSENCDRKTFVDNRRLMFG